MKVRSKQVTCFLLINFLLTFVNSRAEETKSLNEQLYDAAREGSVKDVVRLLDQGANPKAHDVWGKTAIHYAIEYHQKDMNIIRELYRRGNSLDRPPRDRSEAPLALAIRSGSMEAIKTIFELSKDSKNLRPNVIDSLYYLSSREGPKGKDPKEIVEILDFVQGMAFDRPLAEDPEYKDILYANYVLYTYRRDYKSREPLPNTFWRKLGLSEKYPSQDRNWSSCQNWAAKRSSVHWASRIRGDFLIQLRNCKTVTIRSTGFNNYSYNLEVDGPPIDVDCSMVRQCSVRAYFGDEAKRTLVVETKGTYYAGWDGVFKRDLEVHKYDLEALVATIEIWTKYEASYDGPRLIEPYEKYQHYFVNDPEK